MSKYKLSSEKLKKKKYRLRAIMVKVYVDICDEKIKYNFYIGKNVCNIYCIYSNRVNILFDRKENEIT